ncbi:PREDICTED: uncharacterized protein LOC109147749 [Ipomoea nil]|uniref:uncharacterized protein LOC109147749 n=1 Tax=Ipomoea nil TaxID=35883 RepID=UPI00090140E8|nr:PREDICTED: uncharacterized protein LOC109147749 [Ipomoea nil]
MTVNTAGVKPVFKEAGEASDEGSPISNFHINAALNSHDIWILDSGATDHITYSLGYFEEYHSTHDISVRLLNGQVVEGSPGTMGGFARQENGLYLINHPPSKRKRKSNGLFSEIQCNSVTVEMWHCRLRHYPINKIHLLNGIKSVSFHKQLDFVCDACHLARQKRSPFPIKGVRTDNGTEFMMDTFFREKGIFHQRSCVYTPQQNGVVERKHQNILSVARALRFQSGIPIQFWGHCVIHTSYLINRLPTEVLNGKTPYEMLTGKTAYYSQLRTLGCLCFGGTISHGRNKMQPRARKCIFLGFPANVKGYILYDIVDKGVFVSRDVKFYELIYPFKEQSADYNDNFHAVEGLNPSLPWFSLTLKQNLLFCNLLISQLMMES